MIYFDHNATTPIDKRVVEAMLPFLHTFYGNPSSLYRAGRVVRSAIETAREQVATLVDAMPSQIIFTSGGTEANNLALKEQGSANTLAVSSVEHPSVLELCDGNDLIIPVDESGLVSEIALADIQKNNSLAMVSIMLANNETGVIQDVARFSQLLQNKQVLLHTDAVQAIGKIPVSFKQLGVNLMSLSSHKIYGPKGCGALVVDDVENIEPLVIGGGQEYNKRSGTENVAAIIGFGKAAELAMQELDQRTTHCLELKKYLEQGLHGIPDLVVFSEQVSRLPNTIQFGHPRIDGEMLLMQLDQSNIAVSSGSACASAGGKPSSVLMAMGIDTQLAKSAIRISLGKDNTKEEINQFLRVLNTFI